MYCKKCGAQINDEALFCKKCGAKQTDILSTDEMEEKSDMNKQEIRSNTYTDESTTLIENEPSKDNHKTKIKKKWLLLIVISVPLILIVIFLMLWNVGIFENRLSESDVRTAISNHMRDAHGVRIEEFIDISIDKSGAQATVIIIYDEEGYDVTYPPSTVLLNKQGAVISCIFCQSDSEENATSSSEEVDDTIVGTFETDNRTTAHYRHIVFYDNGDIEAYTGTSWTNYPYWPSTIVSEQVPNYDSGTYTESGDIITVNLHKIGGFNCTLKFQKVKNNLGEPLLIIIDADHAAHDNRCLDGENRTEEVGVGYVKVSNRYLERSSHSDIDTTPAEGTILRFSDNKNNSADDETTNTSSDSTCPRCGREIIYGNSCECTWCDICNAWMLGHGHGEGEEPVNSSTSQSSTDSTSAQSGTGSTDDYDYSFEGQEITITRYRSNNRSGVVVIPTTIDGKRVTKIGNGAFDIGINNNVIESVIIPNGVTEIGIYAFRFCHGLTSITIPKSVTSIGFDAFAETNISSVYFEGNAPSGTGTRYSGDYKVYYKAGTTGWDNEIWSNFVKETW